MTAEFEPGDVVRFIGGLERPGFQKGKLGTIIAFAKNNVRGEACYLVKSNENSKEDTYYHGYLAIHARNTEGRRREIEATLADHSSYYQAITGDMDD